MNKKICEMVTNRLIEELEKGIIPWERPWHGGEGAISHSTGHSSRLARFEGNAKNAAFGSTEYSKEELVAEIGAASLVNHCGLETRSSFRNSAAYIQSWLEALRNDPTMIVAAAGKAEKAINYILNIEAI